MAIHLITSQPGNFFARFKQSVVENKFLNWIWNYDRDTFTNLSYIQSEAVEFRYTIDANKISFFLYGILGEGSLSEKEYKKYTNLLEEYLRLNFEKQIEYLSSTPEPISHEVMNNDILYCEKYDKFH